MSIIDAMRRANGTGNVYLRSDGRWEARLTLGSQDGRQLRRSFFGHSEEEAAAKMEAARRDLDVGLILAGPRLTVARYLRDWLVVSELRVRPSTFRRYRQLVENNILPAIGHIPLMKLTPTAVERMLADARNAGLSPRTAHHMRAVLRTGLRRAMKHGLIRTNPAELADPPKVEQRERPVLSPDEVRSLLQAVTGSRYEALYWLAVLTGLRKGELLALRADDVDLDAGSLRVRSGKTAKARRQIGLPASLLPILRRHKAQQEMDRRVSRDGWTDSGLLFTRDDGQALYGTLVHRDWDRVRAELGRPDVHWHDLRHSANTLMASLGISTRDRMTIMGHANSRMTEDVYNHSLPEGLRDAADRIGSWLAEAK